MNHLIFAFLQKLSSGFYVSFQDVIQYVRLYKLLVTFDKMLDLDLDMAQCDFTLRHFYIYQDITKFLVHDFSFVESSKFFTQWNAIFP